MRILLDTNVLVKGMAGVRLPRAVKRLLSDPGSEFVVSIISAWEIVNKPNLGRSVADIHEAIRGINGTLLHVQFRHLEELAKLPFRRDHHDPFDRMLIAQALSEDIPILTSDTRFEEYRRLRVLWD